MLLRIFVLTITLTLLNTGMVGAALVRNMTTDVDLFFDDYEGVDVTGGDDDPVVQAPSPGTWTVLNESTPKIIQVVANPTAPQAFQGTQFLRADRPASHGTMPNPRLSFDLQNTIGDIIHWESMVYVPSVQETSTHLMSLYGGWDGSGTSANIHLLPQANGDMLRFAGVRIDTGLDFALDTWQKWQIDYQIGERDFTLTLGPNSSTVPLRVPITPEGFGEFRYGNEPGGLIYFDAAGTTGPPSTDFAWVPDTSSNWHLPGVWGAMSVPNSPEHTATFGDVISAPRGVVNDQAVTVNAVTFDSSQTYAVGGPGSLNLEANSIGTMPTIDVIKGTHEFQLRVNLNDNTTANVAANSTVEFNHRLNLDNHTFVKIGGGTLAINNDLTTGSGTISCLEGTCSGTGTIGGNLANLSATVSPGNSLGALVITDDYTPGTGDSLNATSVPEPGSFVLLAMGIVGMAWTALRR